MSVATKKLGLTGSAVYWIQTDKKQTIKTWSTVKCRQALGDLGLILQILIYFKGPVWLFSPFLIHNTNVHILLARVLQVSVLQRG